MMAAKMGEEKLIIRSEKVRFIDVLSMLFLRRPITSYAFVDAGDRTAADFGSTPGDWFVALTQLIQKALDAAYYPALVIGAVVEFLLNFVALNNGILGIFLNIFRCKLVIPHRDAPNFRSMIGLIDGRTELKPLPASGGPEDRRLQVVGVSAAGSEDYYVDVESGGPAFSPPDRREASKLSVSSRSGQLQETPMPMKSCKSRGDATLRSSYPPAHKKWNDPLADCCTSTRSDRAVDSDVFRCQSALSYRGVCSSRILPSEDDSLARALRSCHSLPFSFVEEGETGASGMISLAEYLGTNVADHIPETPNNLSEEMVRCMAGIYCRLSDPPLVHHGSSSSPSSSFSSTSAISPQYVGDMWSPHYKRETTLDSRLINPFHVEGLKEFSGPYNTMVEVPMISRDSRRLKEAEDLLQTYKLILYRLEAVDLRRMTDEEKIAFWVNIHNALLMHAYLKNGVPQNNLKKTSLLVKAACKIAGRNINAAVIQSIVLGCNTHCPGQWLRTLLYPRIKSKVSKVGHEWRAFAVAQSEPLLRFALCSGSHSDPAVRVYTPKRLFHQLEAAKEEFIRATAGVWKEQKLLLPKLVEAYGKDVKLSPQGLVDMVQRYLPESMRMAVQRCQQGGRSSGKVVEWVPYNPAFRYLLARDLAFPHLS